MKADKKNSILRFAIIIAMLTLVGAYIIITALNTMIYRHDYWQAVASPRTSPQYSSHGCNISVP